MNTNEQEMQKLRYIWSRTWWTFVILGIIAVALGVFTLVNPQGTASVPIQLLGVFIVLDGLFRIITAVWERKANWFNRVLVGIAGILIGILIYGFAQEIIEFALTFILYLAGIGFLISGGVSVLWALQGRREWTGILTGALLIGIGILFFALTGPIALSVVWITGLFLLGIGVVMVIAGFRIRQMGRQLEPRIKGDIVEGQVVEGEFVEHDVVEGEIKQIPDHFDD